MADWTNIANTALQPGAPVRSIDGVALRDNPIAIAEGAAGAPRIQTNGIQNSAVTNAKIANSAVTNAKIANSAVTNNKLQPPTAGTNFLIRRLQEATTAVIFNTSYTDTGFYLGLDTGSHLGVTVLVAGTITAYLQHRRIGTSATSFVRVLKNGAQVAQWSTTSTSLQTRQVNISVAVGDVIIFQNRISTDSGTAGSEWRFLRIYSNNPNFAVA